MNNPGVTLVGLFLILVLFLGWFVHDESLRVREIAEKEGAFAHTDGAPIWANPYPLSDKQSLNDAWRKGWKAAESVAKVGAK